MPLVLANRVQETGTANTTVSFTLTGAVTGFQSFAVIGNTNTTYYSATDGSGNWEVGLGTYSTTGPTLTRTTVYASSNSGSAVTFPGAVNVFVTYPSGRSVNLNETGNVSALGTVSSGTWQGSTVGVAYGGTGVTTSSGPNSVVLRDANENITINRLSQGLQNITASGGTTTLTAASDFNQLLTGTGNHTFRLPDATTLTDTTAFQFNNAATGTLTIQNNASTTIGTVTTGGAANAVLISNATVGGTWEIHGYLPEGVTWGTNALDLGTTVISNGTWQGGTIQPAYGGTGLTSFTTNGAVYATGTTTLTSGTLPVISGGTGATASPTNGQLLIGNGSTYTVASLGTGTGISTSVGSGTLTINNTGVTSLAGTSPVTASASTGAVIMSLAGGYGDTQNPYASKTANFFLAAPNGSAGVPSFRGIVAADIPTLNQNTTGSAGSVANAVTFNNGGAGDASGTTFNGSAARTISYNTVGAPSTGGTNATGTWGISISGNAATATTASNVNNGALSLGVSGTGLSGSASFTANQSGNSTFTVTSNATNLNTASTIVARDASGNFSAGTITATLNGSATSAGSVSNSLTLATSGTGLSGSATFNGSSAQTFTVTSNATSSNTASTIVARDASGNFSAGTVTGTNFADAIGTYNVNLGSGGIEGRGAVAGYSGGSYGGIGYNVRHTTTGGQYIAPLSDTSNYLLFNQGFTFLGAGSGSAGRTLSYTTLATINSSGAFNTLGAITQNGSQVLTAGNFNSYAPTLTGGGASGTWGISISGNAATATTANALNSGNNYSVNQLLNNTWYNYNDNDRNAGSATYYPNASARAFRLAFVSSSSVGTGGNYAGLMQFNPWDGTTASTGDASYQMAWGSTAANSGGVPQLRIRKGIDSTWNAWLDIITSSNYTSYSPTLTGSGASGTWGISISGNAATATSATSATTATNWGSYGGVPAAGTSFGNANTIGRSDANGYTYFNYINSNTPNNENGTVSQVIITNGSDNFYRKASIAHLTSNLSGTAPINISGNAANTSSISNAVGSTYTWTATQYFTGNGNTASASNIGAQAYSTGGNGAIMAFHRSGAYAVNMGLDSDNVFRIGGWSAPANLLQMTMAGNLTMAGSISGTSLAGSIATGSGASGTWGISISGSAATLTTGRTIGMTGDVSWTSASFNGSANVTGTATLANSGVTAGTYTNATVTVDAKGRVTSASSGGGSGITVTDDNSTNATRYLTFTSATSGSITGVNVSSTKLTYNPSTGALISTTVAGNSDERLKTNWRDLQADFIEQLATVKTGVYDRTDMDVPVTQVGVTAQTLRPVLPNAVLEDVDGMLSVAYGNAALVSAVELAKRVVEQEARINRLEALVARLMGE